MTIDGWLTVKEAAAILRYDPQTVWRKIRRGEIPGVQRHGRSIRIARVALMASASRYSVIAGTSADGVRRA